ncbi:MAG: hypothetical protein ACI9EF_003655 [Pseudohongiellaceae bacterium]|jgi:hypothetical protein
MAPAGLSRNRSLRSESAGFQAQLAALANDGRGTLADGVTTQLLPSGTACPTANAAKDAVFADLDGDGDLDFMSYGVVTLNQLR